MLDDEDAATNYRKRQTNSTPTNAFCLTPMEELTPPTRSESDSFQACEDQCATQPSHDSSRIEVMAVVSWARHLTSDHGSSAKITCLARGEILLRLFVQVTNRMDKDCLCCIR